MKFAAIAALVATASAADLDTHKDCSAKDATCKSTDCCGVASATASAPTDAEVKEVTDGVKAKVGDKLATICFTKDAKIYKTVKATAADASTKTWSDAGIEKDKVYVAVFKCNPATGASALAAAATVLAASMYMAWALHWRSHRCVDETNKARSLLEGPTSELRPILFNDFL